MGGGLLKFLIPVIFRNVENQEPEDHWFQIFQTPPQLMGFMKGLTVFLGGGYLAFFKNIENRGYV